MKAGREDKPASEIGEIYFKYGGGEIAFVHWKTDTVWMVFEVCRKELFVEGHLLLLLLRLLLLLLL